MSEDEATFNMNLTRNFSLYIRFKNNLDFDYG